ncbi:PilZ domain-containing protein [Myxococcota bacterium]|nr:PilZ domain-containing protein [Myxococcota bacterium]MBU1431337.1 PilZ domain-containing protein [Myxococcota bacterium]MBU1900273.1 PilZ domain-containing protein [Myxococcota bacterium]
MTQQKRRAPRVPLHISVSYTDAQGPQTRPAHNLSILGVFLRTPQPLEEGSPLELELSLPSGPLRLSGEVRRSRTNPFKNAGMGIAFCFKDEADAARVAALIEEAMFEGIGGALFSALEGKSAPDDLP